MVLRKERVSHLHLAFPQMVLLMQIYYIYISIYRIYIMCVEKNESTITLPWCLCLRVLKSCWVLGFYDTFRYLGIDYYCTQDLTGWQSVGPEAWWRIIFILQCHIQSNHLAYSLFGCIMLPTNCINTMEVFSVGTVHTTFGLFPMAIYLGLWVTLRGHITQIPKHLALSMVICEWVIQPLCLPYSLCMIHYYFLFIITFPYLFKCYSLKINVLAGYTITGFIYDKIHGLKSSLHYYDIGFTVIIGYMSYYPYKI